MVSALGGLGLLLAACSSGPASAAGSNSTSTTTGGAANASFTAYENCLKSHGVSFPTGGFGGRGSGGPPSSGSTTRPTLSPSERSAFTKAETACASLRPKFNGGGGGSTAFAAYRNCLMLHGVTLPRGGGAGGFPGSGTSTSTTSDPKTKAAMAACASLRPKGGLGGFPGRTTTTTS